MSSLTVSTEYFRTMEARVLSGRAFNRADTASGRAGGDREPGLRRQALAGRRCARQAAASLRGQHAGAVADGRRRRVEHHSERPDPADVRAAGLSAVSAEAGRRRVGVRSHACPAREPGVSVPPRSPGAGFRAADLRTLYAGRTARDVLGQPVLRHPVRDLCVDCVAAGFRSVSTASSRIRWDCARRRSGSGWRSAPPPATSSSSCSRRG